MSINRIITSIFNPTITEKKLYKEQCRLDISTMMLSLAARLSKSGLEKEPVVPLLLLLISHELQKAQWQKHFDSSKEITSNFFARNPNHVGITQREFVLIRDRCFSLFLATGIASGILYWQTGKKKQPSQDDKIL